MAEGPSSALRSTRPPVPLARYFAGLAITVLAILSQYFVPQALPATQFLYDNLPGDLFVVYGIPIIAFAFLVGGGPLRNWYRNLRTASWQGLRWFGLLLTLAFIVTIVLEVIYNAVDPAALKALSKVNPALQQAEGDPWFYVGFSFVIGAFEETIFRGWIFGYWRDRRGTWLVPATWTSAVFAGVHLYYATTYGPAYPLLFPSLFFAGFAFAATYQVSGGNLVVPAFLHGAYDATSYLTLINETLGVVLRFGLIGVGLLIALLHYRWPSKLASVPIPPPAR